MIANNLLMKFVSREKIFEKKNKRKKKMKFKKQTNYVY